MSFIDPGDFTPLQIVSETNMDNIRNDLLYLNDRIAPAGGLMPYGGSSAPTGWLLCDGSAVSRTTYAGLFAIIGSTYGAGNGSTTFNVPDLQFKFPMGKAASGTGSSLGGSGGSGNAITVSHNHAQDVHGHSGNSHNHAQDVHGHGITDPQHDHTSVSGNIFPFSPGTVQAQRIPDAGSTSNGVYVTYTSVDGTSTGVTVNNTTATNQAATQTVNNTTATNQSSGSSGTDANLPPYLVFLYIIKT